MKAIHCQLLCYVTLTLLCTTNASNWFWNCFKKDSISCFQMQIFQKSRELFDIDSVELFDGLRLEKDQQSEDSARAFQYIAAQDRQTEQNIVQLNDTESRQQTIEQFLEDRISGFFEHRKISWNVNKLFDRISDIWSNEEPESETESEFEGRKKMKMKKIKKKDMMKILLIKGKAILILFIKYIITFIIAKKALKLALIAILLSIGPKLKRLLMMNQDDHSMIVEHHPFMKMHESSYGPPSSSDYGGHSESIPQQMAYHGH